MDIRINDADADIEIHAEAPHLWMRLRIFATPLIETTVRRSQRVRNLQTLGNFGKRWELIEANFRRFLQNAEKRKAAQIKKSLKEISKSKKNSELLPAASSTPNPQRSTLKSRSRKMKTNVLPEIAESPNEGTAEDGQMSKTQNVFSKTKTLRVRIRRHREDAESNSSLQSPPEISSSTSPSSKHPEISNTGSTSFHFNEFLKNLLNTPSLSNSGSHSFRSMSLSSLSDLEFKLLKNVNYAFYTEEKNSIGYIFLQPGQMKPPCKVKNPTNFIVKMGKVRIECDGDICYPKEGDLVAINAESRFSIENLGDDDSAILFVKT